MTWQHKVTCPKCGDPTGLIGPKYDADKDMLVLNCTGCEAKVELKPLDRRTRERRERVKAMLFGLRGWWSAAMNAFR